MRFKWTEGIEWAARLDMTTEEIVMEATIPNKSYVSIGFGPNMRGTDMIVWRWKDEFSLVDNLYSTKTDVPPSDGTNFLTSSIKISADGKSKTFTTRRAFDTGSPLDFVIQPGKEIVMCYAYRTGSGDFIQHKVRDVFSLKFSASGTAAAGDADLTELRRNTFYESHGWWMWTVWIPIGFLLLATKRYFKKQYSCMHFIHVVCGYFCMLTTLIWTIKMLKYFDWKINSDPHSILGIAACSLTVIVAASGSVTWGLMFKNPSEWKANEYVTSAGKFHRYCGYLMLALGNATAFSGI